MTGVAEFLAARIAEDETAAREAAEGAGGGTWKIDSKASCECCDVVVAGSPPPAPAIWTVVTVDDRLSVHIARHDPAQALADAYAKRQLLDAYTKATANQLRLHDAGLHLVWTILGDVVRTLAAAHSEHPDYNPEWRP